LRAAPAESSQPSNAPNWPGAEGDPADLRANPYMELTCYDPKEIVAHYELIIRALPEPPILIERTRPAGVRLGRYTLD
jgi:hypothetical protein